MSSEHRGFYTRGSSFNGSSVYLYLGSRHALGGTGASKDFTAFHIGFRLFRRRTALERLAEAALPQPSFQESP